VVNPGKKGLLRVSYLRNVPKSVQTLSHRAFGKIWKAESRGDGGDDSSSYYTSLTYQYRYLTFRMAAGVAGVILISSQN